MLPIFDQNITETISQTVTKAIDAGNTGIMVLQMAGMIILASIMGVLILRVLVPLLRQVIELTSQVTTIVQKANEALEHNNETNTLVVDATNKQTGAIQKMDKTVGEMGGRMEVLALNFGAYQTLQSDTTSELINRFDKFETTLAGIKALIETNTGDHAAIKDALLLMAGNIKAAHDDIRKLLPPPPLVTVINTAPPAELPKASGE